MQPNINELLLGALLIFLATTAGAALIYVVKNLSARSQAALMSFSAGMMAFASAEMFLQSEKMSGLLMTCTGIAVGAGTVLLFERLIPHIHSRMLKRGELEHSKKKAALLAGTIAIHNLPEGFAVASAFASSTPLGWLVAWTIAIQDIPEGFLVSAPASVYGIKKRMSFFYGAFSGFAEAVAVVIGFVFLGAIAPLIPISLAFSSGAMAYVVLVELLPDAFASGRAKIASLAMIAGFLFALLLAGIFAM
ncbi:MAG: ZIP family metal transporter [Candidatus Micrarchaeia archaeon]